MLTIVRLFTRRRIGNLLNASDMPIGGLPIISGLLFVGDYLPIGGLPIIGGS